MIRGVTCASCGTGSADAGGAERPSDSIAPCPDPLRVRSSMHAGRGRTARPGARCAARAPRGPDPAATAGERAALTGSIVASAVCGALAVVCAWAVDCSRAVAAESRRRSHGRVRRCSADEPIVRLHSWPEALRRGRLRRRAGRVGRSERTVSRRAVADGLAPVGWTPGVRGAHDGPDARWSDRARHPLSRPRHGVLSTGVGFRRATSARTSGATCVPSSSIAVITARCGTVPSANCTRVRS